MECPVANFKLDSDFGNKLHSRVRPSSNCVNMIGVYCYIEYGRVRGSWVLRGRSPVLPPYSSFLKLDRGLFRDSVLFYVRVFVAENMTLTF